MIILRYSGSTRECKSLVFALLLVGTAHAFVGFAPIRLRHHDPLHLMSLKFKSRMELAGRPSREDRPPPSMETMCASQRDSPLAADGLTFTRADALGGLLAMLVVGTASMCRASESVDSFGVVDDLLADCPATPTCVSSQDDRPYPFMEPWTYEGPWERAMSKLRSHLELQGAKVVASSPRYLRVELDAANAVPATVDDAEFYFTPSDALIQFRCARRGGLTDFGATRRRMDGIRVALRFEAIPVLRNRRRAFIFGESPIDSFGPPLGNLDPSIIYGDTDPMTPPFETPSASMKGHVESIADRPVWWGRPLAEAGGFANWRQPQATRS